jgi:hypothetical protein
MAKNLTRQEIEEKLESLIVRLTKKSPYKINYSVSSKEFPDLKDVELTIRSIYRTECFKTKSRESQYVFYRQIFCKVAHDLGYKDPKIAAYLNKDRTTIIYAVKQVKNYLQIKDPEMTKVYETITNHLINTYGETIFRRNIISGDYS